MVCRTYALNSLESYKYVVIFARHNGRWLFCKHRRRDTWEAAGGHIEQGETPLEAARRELFEETGALRFEIQPLFDYWASDEPTETDNVTNASGMVFLAEVAELGALPESEMERAALFDALPERLTYPDIVSVLFPLVQALLTQ